MRLKKVEGAWKQFKPQKHSPIQSFLYTKLSLQVWACSWTFCCPCSLFVGFYPQDSGQIIIQTRYVKCKSSPKIPEIQWITLQPNPYSRSTNILTSFDSQFWTSIDSFSVPLSSHCATRRRYSPVQISFLPCPVGRLKWPQSNHDNLSLNCIPSTRHDTHLLATASILRMVGSSPNRFHETEAKRFKTAGSSPLCMYRSNPKTRDSVWWQGR